MSHRSDIIDGRLLYSCNCGWLDLAHAGLDRRAQFADPFQGQRNLWRQLSLEAHPTHQTLNKRPAFLVRYRQQMHQGPIGADYTGAYLVQAGLALPRKKSIGTRILLDVSRRFEGLQAAFPYGLITDSGFSPEDLISDLIGFYKEADNLPEGVVHMKCSTLSDKASVEVWDRHLLHSGLGATKSYSIQNPRYFACEECMTPPLVST